MVSVKEMKNAMLHLLFPHVCAGCGSDVLDRDMVICLRCIHELPKTDFECYADNPVEKIFWGRLNLQGAFAQYFFTKGSLIQRLMHAFKYKGEEEVGRQLGRLMGESMRKAGRIVPDVLVPLPLYEKKEKLRGYNQAAVICEGISDCLNIPVLTNAICRPSFTETQTRKGRVERWQNIEGKFHVACPELIRGRHVLLVDDVVTTGATLESCGNEILKQEEVELSVAALCYSSH